VATPHSRRNRTYRATRAPDGVYRPEHTARAYRVTDPAIASAPPGSPIEFVLSTPGTKRDGLDLATLPFTKERYDRAPVVLAFHRYDQFSVGRGEIEIVSTRGGEALLAAASFDIDDPIGAEADRKYRSGFMFAVSLGWDDIDDRGVPVRVSKRRAVARDILEFSVVSVPADPDALIDMTPEDAARTRSFMSGVRALLPEGDLRIPDLDEILRRLAECEGAECDILLAQAGHRLDERRGFHVPGHLAGPYASTEGDAADASAVDAEAQVHVRGGTDDVSDDTEARRRAVMAAMVAAVWVDNANDADDDDRRAARKALIPEYGRLGLVPPAFLPASVVAALPPERRAALFVNGEPEELEMTTVVKRPVVAGTNGAGTRAGAKFSSATRSELGDIHDAITGAAKRIKSLLDDGGERGADARSCGCGSGSSHAPAQAVVQASGQQAATTLEAELARLSELFPGVELTATVPDDQGGSRGLVGIHSLQEAGDESEVMYLDRPAATLPDDLKQMISDEVAAQIAAGPTDESVSISLSAWLQSEDPEWRFEPGTKALFSFDLTPEMAERIKAAALGLEQPAAAEEPPAEETEEPAEETPAEEVPADGTASATAPDGIVIDAATLALFQAAA